LLVVFPKSGGSSPILGQWAKDKRQKRTAPGLVILSKAKNRSRRLLQNPSREKATNLMTDSIQLLPDQYYRNLILDEQRYPRAELEGAIFDACSLQRIDLRDARLNGAVFRDCNLTGARLAGANMFGVTFERCKLMGVDFHDGLTLTAATFTGCILDYTIFRGVALDKMVFRECTFVEADLSLTNLRLATFADCDLTGVDLIETEFFQTDLRGSTLGGWHLRRTDLSGIVVTSAQMRELALAIGIVVVD
jgi:uncharacterized protein YjbI with pentapeptide repeats